MIAPNSHLVKFNRWYTTGFVVLILFEDVVHSFIPPLQRANVLRNDFLSRRVDIPTTDVSTSKLYWGFFRRNNDSNEIEEPKIVETEKDDVESTDIGSSDPSSSSSTVMTTTTTTVEVMMEPPTKVLTPKEEATRLRNEAAKSRLEAERMDAELTLRKIEKLKKLMKKQEMDIGMMNATTPASVAGNIIKNQEDLRRQVELLQRKIRGEPPLPVTNTATISTTIDTTTTATVTELVWPNYTKPFDEEEFQIYRDFLKAVPQFLLASTALQVELEIEMDTETKKTKPIDKDQLAKRIDQLNRQDFSYSKKKPPTFTPQQIGDVQKAVETFMASDEYTTIQPKNTKNNGMFQMNGGGIGDDQVVNAFFRTDDVEFMIKSLKGDTRYQKLWDTKDTKSIAQLVLEYQYYVATTEEENEKLAEQIVVQALTEFATGTNNISVTNTIIDSLYPKCTTKRDIVFGDAGNNNEPSPIPTEAAVNKLISDVLPKANFQTSSKPEPVLGGYLIRGTTKLNGDAFIDQLDQVMEKSNLKNQMSVFYVNEVSTFISNEDTNDSFSITTTSFPDIDPPPILYVTSVNVCRESLPFRLSIVSAFGLATSWYFSVYPFLLNPSIATRVDEQLAIADANMVPDLTFLSDLSLPLFAAFMIIQLSHELGHLVVAGANGIKTSPPTFVPSLFTGLTATVTTFRTPPKNTATMFDYSAAGPIAGIITSILAIAVGCQITSVTQDMSSFPSLPLEILRQSTLGGGIIEYILGNGVLSLPKAAIGTAAVAGMTVPLHPIAIAGFVSLIINSLAVLPIGTTDGGRMAISLFGRAFKISVATLAQIAILFLGSFGGSDLFLFYFMFCVLFQRGNEIPSRNETDKLDLTRGLVAGGLYVIAALTLIPFQ